METLQKRLNNYLTKKAREELKYLVIVRAEWWKLTDLINKKEDSNSLFTEEQAKKIDGEELNLSEYPNLKKIIIDGKYLKSPLTKIELGQQSKLNYLFLPNNELKKIDLSFCPNLKEIWVWNNHLTDLVLGNKKHLIKLGFSNNLIDRDLTFLANLKNLEELYVDNNYLCGSLEPLKLNKLKHLHINGTDINSGLEYLSGGVKGLHCLVDTRRDAKCQIIYNLFANNQGEVETKENGGITNFPQKLHDYKQWRKFNFSEEEIKQWINSGAVLDDHGFVAWLRGTKKETPQWITNYKEDYQKLSRRFREYGLCKECNQPNTGEQWCQPCNTPRIKENFNNWTSHNPQIDQFIQKYQLQATEANKFIEWIPYEQFEIEKDEKGNNKILGKGGFSEVYKAKWAEGNIHHWDTKNKQWQREKDKDKANSTYYWKKHKDHQEVVLKSLNNSQNNTYFLDETAKHKVIDDWFNNIVPCYGLSQDPNTGNYLMVMQYMPEGNLRNYLSNKNQELTLKDKLGQLLHLAQGLKDIHNNKLIHRDFHSGNILKGTEKTKCLITDLGLCKPVDESKQEDKIYGVLPYMAPEVLRSQPYTQASDVYSFGIVAYELLSGLPPYYDKSHDVDLALEICKGLRPQFQIKIPRLLEDLINRCWDIDSVKRPSANELERILRSWESNAEFKTQLQEAEEHNKTLPEEIKYPKYQIHSGASYHSKFIPTKEIIKLLTEQYQASRDLELNLDNFDESIIQENQSTEQPQQQALQIQSPNYPGSPKQLFA
ncbi:MAG: hypothetical protein MRERV_38c014 [Mycoplasmataceae bacterium RV_VA103A]|nr:MAG: hypothetical protein MRERV_38c014 [Mycoplasmataceae bacterium RV_VA103A]